MIVYEVVTRHYDDGAMEVKRNAVTLPDGHVPDSGYWETVKCDVYKDYFTDEDDAKAFENEAVKGSG